MSEGYALLRWQALCGDVEASVHHALVHHCGALLEALPPAARSQLLRPMKAVLDTMRREWRTRLAFAAQLDALAMLLDVEA